MSTSITIRRYLDKQDVRYATISCPGDQRDILRFGTDTIPPQQIAKAVILKDLRGMLMAVLPGSHNLNLDALNRQLHRNLQLADIEDYSSIFNDCSPTATPPLGEAYGFETIVDDSLLDQDLVYFLSGNSNEFVRISGLDFQLLHSNAWFGNAFSQIREDQTKSAAAEPASASPDSSQDHAPFTPANKIRAQIEKLTNLPPMPTMAQKILQLNANPYAHAEDLARLIEKDPSLSAQIVRYAQSPLYGYQGNLSSVRQAISRVLGYDLVMNIALGIAASRPFKNSPHGALGLKNYWRHATYSAALVQALSLVMPRKQRPRPGTAYLCGLLHNFGFLLMGYLYPKEFALLNNAVADDPDTSIIEHEKKLLGVTHCEVGSWLMEAWNMPKEISIAIAEHHNPAYNGPDAEYARMVFLSDALLKRNDIGDADSHELPLALIEELGLLEQQVENALEKTIQGSEQLENMAKQLAA